MNKFLVNSKRQSGKFELELNIGGDARMWNCLDFSIKKRPSGIYICFAHIDSPYDIVSAYMSAHSTPKEFGSFNVRDGIIGDRWNCTRIIDTTFYEAASVCKMHIAVEDAEYEE